jgi:Histidine kinase-, DNA gyrase B-, and HSP90-like ATPase
MKGYQSSHLWKQTLASRPKDKLASYRTRLRTAFEQSRERASTLAGEIPFDVRDLTVHDVTHFDALWEMADLVVGPKLQFTPLEGLVLGEAFLIHDLGMGLAAYPGGLAELKKKPEWQDLLHVSMKKKLGRAPQDDELQNSPQAVIDEVKFWVLRSQHAERAEELALTQWKDQQSGHTFYIIEDTDVRVALGKIIGRITHSHWWPVDSLVSRLTPKSIGAPVPFPGEWTVDPLKLALVLRLADAAHLDKRRAPTFLKALRDPKGESLPHWTFQAKLHQLQRKHDRLVYTGEAFAPGEAAAWWLCCDVLRMVDAELRQVDNLSADLNRDRFAARGVLGAEHPQLLANYIPTEGWLPVDASVKATDIATLVQKLGGRELYGDDGTVPLRELIQNATDAVRARRVLEGRGPTWGNVVVRLGRDDGGPWIEVKDNGVGMSQNVVTGPFLDFGTSFWSTPDAVREFPSLLSAGFESTGRYGIGFFSVFMWGDRVRVTTRRYDEAKGDTRILEFHDAIKSRPLLRQASREEFLREGGTVVRVWPRG